MKATLTSFWIAAVMLVCAMWLTSAQAQISNTGVVRGTVTDPTGAVIAKASVKLTSTKPEYNRTVTTDEDGHYRFVAVPFAPFQLHVEAPGFAPADFRGEVSTAAVLTNIQFKGASAAVQQITVTGSVMGLASSSSHVDFDEEQLEKRPLQSQIEIFPRWWSRYPAPFRRKTAGCTCAAPRHSPSTSWMVCPSPRT